MGGQIISLASVRLEQAPAVARSAESLGGVVVYGLNELQDAKTFANDFVEAWRDAMCLEIGAEEFEKFCLERRKKYFSRRA